jgi:hypothetical protein
MGQITSTVVMNGNKVYEILKNRKTHQQLKISSKIEKFVKTFFERYFTSRVHKFRGTIISVQMLNRKYRGAVIERKCRGAYMGAQMSRRKYRGANVVVQL